ncbi:SULT1C2 [Branchiostoma lanceolatum]|uniref:Sulfotransferase n=1 Tax=Branchiostoma lanceolatum TaxID=7740 RepID=A0A8J9YZT4_BRALA|nr:SULT1C2 [Branchiostoma lanceolatum]
MASSQQDPLPEPPPYVKYQGILFPGLATKESLEAMKTFEIRDDDVVIASYPKSGTMWTYHIVDEILEGKRDVSATRVMECHVPQQAPAHLQYRKTPSPRLMQTHLPVQLAAPGLSTPANKVKIVFVLRNPKDVCVSLYHFEQANPLLNTPESWEQYTKDFLDGKLQYGDYFDHVLGWWQMKDDPHFLFIKHEDMKKDFPSSVKTIASFLEKELTDEHLARVTTNCSLERMRKSLSDVAGKKNIVRKGIVGDWKNHFSGEESAKFDQKYRERMAGSGLEFEFE